MRKKTRGISGIMILAFLCSSISVNAEGAAGGLLQGAETEPVREVVIESPEESLEKWRDNSDYQADYSDGQDRIHYIALNGIDESSDSFLIESNGHFGLVDASEEPGVNPHGDVNEVINYLRAAGVLHLDFIIATHAHSDHIGGIPSISAAIVEESVTISEKIEGGDGQPDTYSDAKPGESIRLPLVDKNTRFYYKTYAGNNYEENELKWNNRTVYNKAKTAMDRQTWDDSVADYDSYTNNNRPKNPNMIDVRSAFDNDIRLGDLRIKLYNTGLVSNADENANSIVTYIENPKSSVKVALFGDLDSYNCTEIKVTRQILNEHGTLTAFKAGHHQWDGSNTIGFLKEMYNHGVKNIVISSSNSIYNSKGYPAYYDYAHDKFNIYRTCDNNCGIVENLDVDGADGNHFQKVKIVSRQNPLTRPVTTPGGDKVTYTLTGLSTELKILGTAAAMPTSGLLAPYLDSKGNVTDVQAYEQHWRKLYTDDGSDFHYVYYRDDGTMIKSRSNTPIVFTSPRGQKYCVNRYGHVLTGWQTTNEGRHYYITREYDANSEGARRTNAWMILNGEDIYLDNDGNIVRNRWIETNGKWYYLDKNGFMVRNGWVNNYYVDGNGVWARTVNDVTGQGTWKLDSTGWWFKYNNNSYAKDEIVIINGTWYHFDSRGYMSENGYYEGIWFDESGAGDFRYNRGIWKQDSKGWKYEDGQYIPINRWLQINGLWYYFDNTGHTEVNAYRDGYWLSSSGAWDTTATMADWKRNNTGWWYQAASGWYPVNQWLMINGSWYSFKADGYMRANEYDGRYWLSASGAWDGR